MISKSKLFEKTFMHDHMPKEQKERLFTKKKIVNEGHDQDLIMCTKKEIESEIERVLSSQEIIHDEFDSDDGSSVSTEDPDEDLETNDGILSFIHN